MVSLRGPARCTIGIEGRLLGVQRDGLVVLLDGQVPILILEGFVAFPVITTLSSHL